MEISKKEFLKRLAEFSDNINVSGFYGSIVMHYADGKISKYNVNQSFRQKDLKEKKGSK